MTKNEDSRLGDEAPEFKHFMVVVVIVAILIGLSWIAYYKFGWFH